MTLSEWLASQPDASAVLSQFPKDSEGNYTYLMDNGEGQMIPSTMLGEAQLAQIQQAQRQQAAQDQVRALMSSGFQLPEGWKVAGGNEMIDQAGTGWTVGQPGQYTSIGYPNVQRLPSGHEIIPSAWLAQDTQANANSMSNLFETLGPALVAAGAGGLAYANAAGTLGAGSISGGAGSETLAGGMAGDTIGAVPQAATTGPYGGYPMPAPTPVATNVIQAAPSFLGNALSGAGSALTKAAVGAGTSAAIGGVLNAGGVTDPLARQIGGAAIGGAAKPVIGGAVNTGGNYLSSNMPTAGGNTGNPEGGDEFGRFDRNNYWGQDTTQKITSQNLINEGWNLTQEEADEFNATGRVPDSAWASNPEKNTIHTTMGTDMSGFQTNPFGGGGGDFNPFPLTGGNDAGGLGDYANLFPTTGGGTQTDTNPFPWINQYGGDQQAIDGSQQTIYDQAARNGVPGYDPDLTSGTAAGGPPGSSLADMDLNQTYNPSNNNTFNPNFTINNTMAPQDTSWIDKLLGGFNTSKVAEAGILAAASKYAADQQRAALEGVSGRQDALARQMLSYGDPARMRLEAAQAPGFSMFNVPGYADSANRAADIATRKWSGGGNPYGNPTLQAGIYRDVLNERVMPDYFNYLNLQGSQGGLGSALGAASNQFGQAGQTGVLAAQQNPYAGYGAAVRTLFDNPYQISIGGLPIK